MFDKLNQRVRGAALRRLRKSVVTENKLAGGGLKITGLTAAEIRGQPGAHLESKELPARVGHRHGEGLLLPGRVGGSIRERDHNVAAAPVHRGTRMAPGTGARRLIVTRRGGVARVRTARVRKGERGQKSQNSKNGKSLFH